MPDNYGVAISFFIIMAILFVTGLLFIMLTPLIDTFLAMGTANIGNGVEANTLSMIERSIKTFFPIVVVMSLILYGWRRSKHQTPGN